MQKNISQQKPLLLTTHGTCINTVDMTDQHCKLYTYMFQSVDHPSHCHTNLVHEDDTKEDRELALTNSLS